MAWQRALDTPFLRAKCDKARVFTPKTLPTDNVLLHECVRSSDALFALVADHVATGDAVLSARIRERLKRRHLWRSVNLGNGFALPHAAVHGLSTLRAVYVRSVAAIHMGSEPEGEPGPEVSDSLTLLIPSPGLSAEHDLLMALTQSLLTPSIANALRAAGSEAEVQQLLVADRPARWRAYAAPVSGSALGAMV